MQAVPVLCVANGKRDAGVHVKGTLKDWHKITHGDKDAIAVIDFKDEAKAVEQIKTAVASGAIAAIIVNMQAPLQNLTGENLDAISVPVVMSKIGLATGNIEATIELDAKGTWTFPSLPAPYTFELHGVELGVDKQVVGKVRRQQPATWTEADGWDVDEEGMIGLPPIWNKRAMQNRQSDKMYRAACKVLEESETIVSIDRFAFFRPTKLPECCDEWITGLLALSAWPLPVICSSI